MPISRVRTSVRRIATVLVAVVVDPVTGEEIVANDGSPLIATSHESAALVIARAEAVVERTGASIKLLAFDRDPNETILNHVEARDIISLVRH